MAGRELSPIPARADARGDSHLGGGVRPSTKSVAVPATIGGGQLLVGILILAVGMAYDWWARDAGLIVYGALILMGGPGFVVALVQARSILATGKIVSLDAYVEEEPDDR